MNILVVEDDDIHFEYFSKALAGYEVRRAATLADAVAQLKEQKPAFIILDAVFPELPRTPQKFSAPLFLAERFLDALDNVSAGASVRPDVLLVSGQEQVADDFDRVAQWLRTGRISDVLPKAMANAGWAFFCAVLKHRIGRLAREHSLEVELERNEAFKQLQESAGIFTKSELFLDIFEIIRRIAEKLPFASVLVDGPTGAGKELIALAIHKQTSPSQRFGALLATTINENLAEAQLFGAVKGAFTSADHTIVGMFEVARKGTVFIDEIGDLTPPLQAKLLRVLETRTFQRLGTTVDIPFEGRVVTATHKDLRVMVSQGGFREDLFYRLNTIEIHVPPLKDHKEDIRLLVDTFKSGRDCGPMFKDEVYEAFQEYEWPGNVRELLHAVERLVGLTSGEVGLAEVRKHLPHIPVPANDPSVVSLRIPGVTRWAGLNDAHAACLCETIRGALNASGRRLLDELSARLDAPSRGQDPRSIHVYKLLLHLSAPCAEINMEQMKQLLGLTSWGQRDKVVAQALAPEGSALLETVDAKGGHRYRIRPALLACCGG
jgi:DNA-binding NtrC family response regulator